MAQIDYEKEGTVFDIQRYSIHDGPGVRTIVFLKGCPLRCLWCSNPESQNPEPELFFRPPACIKCGRCMEVCPTNALAYENPNFVDREKCIKCGACTKVCPTEALKMAGRRMSIAEVMQELRKDANHYRRSGGGVTLSGGEPLFQHAFAKQLLMACHEQGWNTAMETTGSTTREIVRDVIPHVDHVLMDLKVIDPATHQAATGIDNRIILENALCISSLTHTVVRIPVVPGVNNTVEAITAIGNFAKLMPGVNTVHLLPYHTYGENKYALLGRLYPMCDAPNLKPEDMAPFKAVLEGLGFTCVIGG